MKYKQCKPVFRSYIDGGPGSVSPKTIYNGAGGHAGVRMFMYMFSKVMCDYLFGH